MKPLKFDLRRLNRAPAMMIIGLLILGSMSSAQDIRLRMTVLDNIGNSQVLRVGINATATDGIDPWLSEAMIPPPPPLTFDARLIDTDIRTPSILGTGVLSDFRGIYTPQPITQRYEILLQKSAAASTMWIQWSNPLPVGINSAVLVSYPDTTAVYVDMSTQGMFQVPSGMTKFFVTLTFGGITPVTRYKLTLDVDPFGTGSIIAIPNQPDYAPGTTVTLLAATVDTCYTFRRWSGDAAGIIPITVVTMDADKSITAEFTKRAFPLTTSVIDTFFVDTTTTAPQMLKVFAGGAACHDWTVTADVPWLKFSKTSGTGDDSLYVSIDDAEVPCVGSHAGNIIISSPASQVNPVEVPVILIVGQSQLAVNVIGQPEILGCQDKARNFTMVQIVNSGPTPVHFSSAPDLGTSFKLATPSMFPLTVAAWDSATMLLEFAPPPSEHGLITKNVILTGDSCGRQVIFTLRGTRVAPLLTVNNTVFDFGTTYDCSASPPTQVLELTNNTNVDATLSFQVPNGFSLVTTPTSLPANSTLSVTVRMEVNGADSVVSMLGVTADFGECSSDLRVELRGKRRHPAFTVEILGGGPLPPYVFDTTCVGQYSAPKVFSVTNTGTAILSLAVTTSAPFEIESFQSSFSLLPGESKKVYVRFHPVTGGTFSAAIQFNTAQCNLTESTTLTGSTFNQLLLNSNVEPASLLLANCEESGKIKVSITNNGSEQVIFDKLPNLPTGFFWDPSLTTPIVIEADPNKPFVAYITFRPPVGTGGKFGGSVGWFGIPCGASAYFTLEAERRLPLVTVTPANLDFGQIVDCGTPVTAPTKSVSIINQSNLPITIVATAPTALYELNIGGFPMPPTGLTLAAGATGTIDVRAFKGSGGAFNDQLVIEIVAGNNGACRQTFAVNLVGERYKPSFSIVEKKDVRDFGSQCLGTTARRTFYIKNTSDMPLTISCPGFPPANDFTLLQTPLSVQLDTAAEVPFEVRYAPKLVGSNLQTLTFTDNVCNKTVSMTFSGQGVVDNFEIASISPSEPLELWTCELPSTRLVTVKVNNLGSNTTLGLVSKMPEGFILDPPSQLPRSVTSGESIELTFRFVGTAPGTYDGPVILASTSCNVTRTFSLKARILKDRSEVKPTEILYPTIALCSNGSVRQYDQFKLVKDVVLTNTGDVPLTYDVSFNPPTNFFEIVAPVNAFTLTPGQAQPVRIALQAPIPPNVDVIQATLEILVNRAPRCQPERISIPVRVTFTRSAFEISTTELNFQGSCLGEQTEESVTITNKGSVPLTLQPFLGGSSAFSLKGPATTMQLEPGEAKTVTIFYTPRNLGADQGYLTIKDIECVDSLTVALNGSVTKTEVTLSCYDPAQSGNPPTARPGDKLEVPITVETPSPCLFTGGIKIAVEVRFDVLALKPVSAVSAQGSVIMRQQGLGQIELEFTVDKFKPGLLGKLNFEVLLGMENTVRYSISNPVVTPDVVSVILSQNCEAEINLGPRWGVSTRADLGITNLQPNSPNPFSAITNIDFTLDHDADVQLIVYNQLGVEVARLVDTHLKKGLHSVVFNGSALPSGIYIATLKTPTYRQSRKLILAR